MQTHQHEGSGGHLNKPCHDAVKNELKKFKITADLKHSVKPPFLPF